MSDYPLDAQGRFALLSIHKQRCWLCGGRVSLPDMEVDHIIPRQLKHDADLLKKTLEEFGLPTDFDLDNLSNLLPSHRTCNKKKGTHVFRATPIIQVWLAEASLKAQDVRDRQTELEDQHGVDKLLTALETRGENLRPDQIERLARLFAAANTTPVIVTGTGGGSSDDTMTYIPDQSHLQYLPPEKFLVTSDTGVIFDQEPRRRRDADFNVKIVGRKDLFDE